ncbi:hypothetical protein ONS95_010163 [Cadophora gregata]|uniref:uncharacterized protein n=1 Tax=Cadophora gregata TaxID=51156 RepID=UPI0026DA7EAA|nr:uncharacterized protein ONS95_010163 [Cadophora gregata]KAK0121885.1 hypothetical protein ONS95_010163 [Cadophora gregata]KAK0127360.1 hypothetical protein ONS96_006909 [Cadophora gregata f. sp. sojae]
MAPHNSLLQTTHPRRGTTEGPTFTPFPRLPTELRFKIWKVLFRPRRVILWYRGRQPSDDQEQYILVNREARQDFLENYARHFIEYDGKRGYYLNFNLDSICFSSMLLFVEAISLDEDDMARIKKLEITPKPVADHMGLGRGGPKISLKGMTSLELVTLRLKSGLGIEMKERIGNTCRISWKIHSKTSADL